MKGGRELPTTDEVRSLDSKDDLASRFRVEGDSTDRRAIGDLGNARDKLGPPCGAASAKERPAGGREEGQRDESRR